MSTIPNPLDALRRVTPRTGPPAVPNANGLQAQTNTAAAIRPPAAPAVAAQPGPAPLTPSPGGGITKPVAPAPAPAAAAPAAPAAGMYGAGGGTSAPSGSLEDQLRNYYTQAMTGVTSQNYINRAKGQLSTATEGQRQQASNRITDDAIRRGTFRGGDTGERLDSAGRTAQSAYAGGVGDIMQGAEQQDIAARQNAAEGMSGLLSQNRSWDQYQQQRADSMRGGGGGGPQTFTYIDPDTGDQSEIPYELMEGM